MSLTLLGRKEGQGFGYLYCKSEHSNQNLRQRLPFSLSDTFLSIFCCIILAMILEILVRRICPSFCSWRTKTAVSLEMEQSNLRLNFPASPDCVCRRIIIMFCETLAMRGWNQAEGNGKGRGDLLSPLP